ncbi:MAG: ABC transporter permease [Phycisphaerae bacterium]
MSNLLHDLRYAFRTLVKRPGFTTVIVVTLALGIGANTAIFSVISAVLLHPLPFDSPDELVVVGESSRTHGEGNPGQVTYPNFMDWKRQNHVFEDMGTFRGVEYTLSGDTVPERIPGARVSAGFFTVLHVDAAVGRTFRDEDDRVGAENVVLISDSFWQTRCGRDPNLVGQTVMLDGTAFTVIGILPPGFRFPLELSKAEVWTPIALDGRFLSERREHVSRAIARLKPNVMLEQARVDLDTVARMLEEQYPEANTDNGVAIVPLHQQVVGDVRPALLVLLGAVGSVLLIACANAANLLLARSTDRCRELAVRAALGAGRGRLVRQLLTESVLTGAIAGALGLLLAVWGTGVLVALTPADLPRSNEIGINARVLVFALALSLLTGLVFGLAPALRASRVSLHESVKEDGRTSSGTGRHHVRNVLVVSEVALALALLIAAGLLMRSFQCLTNVDPGFQTDDVLTFRMSVPFAGYSEMGKRAALYGQVIERLEGLPGVSSVGAATWLPLEGRWCTLTFRALDKLDPAPGQEPAAIFSSVSPRYFQTLGISLLRGRLFSEADTAGTSGVTVINEEMAQRYWPDENPIGKHIKPWAVFKDSQPDTFEIVGIVRSLRTFSLDSVPYPHIYVPFQQQTWPHMTFALRTDIDPVGLVNAVRSEVAAIAQEEAPFDFKTMEEYLAGSVGLARFSMFLLGLFAVLALVLAVVGVYGVLSYAVAERTHEIGVRMALGAHSRHVLHLVLRQGLTLTATGLGIGLALSLAGTRALSSLLYGIGAVDPVTFISVFLLLGGVALLACYLPARRATRIDPMVALRCE